MNSHILYFRELELPLGVISGNTSFWGRSRCSSNAIVSFPTKLLPIVISDKIPIESLQSRAFLVKEQDIVKVYTMIMSYTQGVNRGRDFFFCFQNWCKEMGSYSRVEVCQGLGWRGTQGKHFRSVLFHQRDISTWQERTPDVTWWHNGGCVHYFMVSMQNSMEAILTCHPALSTKWLDWVAKWCEWWRMCIGLIGCWCGLLKNPNPTIAVYAKRNSSISKHLFWSANLRISNFDI